MRLKNGLTVILMLILVSGEASSQVNRSGTPIVRWFDAMETPGDLQNWCITMDSRGVMYFGNQSRGIVTYDGTAWGLLKVSGNQRVNALETDHRGVVYVGGSDDFGFLQPNDMGELLYHSLADRLTDSLVRSEVETISSIAADSNTVFFTDRGKLYLLSTDDNELSVIDLSKEYNLNDAGKIFVREGRVILSDDREGLFEFTGDSLRQIPGGDKIKEVRFMSLIPYDRESILIATYDSGIFLFNLNTGDLNGNLLSADINNRLKEDLITGAVQLPGSRFAVGVTNNEGIYIFSHEGKLLQQISAETTLLPEATVTAMYCDHTSNSQLWFCTKGYINRAYISLPANEFCSNAVLEDIEEFDGSMYISGDLGLYKGLINDSIRFQFEKPEVLKRPTSKLLKSKTTDGEVLLAATTDGLFQLDIFDEVSTVLDQIEITALKNDLSDPASIMSGSNDGILRTIKYSDDGWAVSDVRGIETVNGAVSAIEQTAIGEWWVLTARPGRLYRLLFNLSDPTLAQYDNSKGLPSDSLNHIVLIDNILYVCTNRGLYSYNTEKDFFEKDTMLVGESFNNAQVNRLLKTTEGEIVISGYDTRNFDALVTPTRQGYVVFKRQFDFLPDIPTIDIEYFDGNIWLVKGRNIYVIDKSKLGYSYGSFKTIFTNITAGSGRVLMNGLFYTTSHRGTRIPSSSQPEGMVPVLKYSENNISFRWTTTSYVEEEKTEYRYRLDGFDRDWSGWEKRNYKDFTNLPFGNYKFRLRAKTITGLESEETVFAFSIRRPWYAAITALFIYVILGSMIVFFTIRWFTKRIRDENKRLENLVRQGKEEVIRQKDELEKDIHYASRIQRALLSTEKFLAQRTSNYFILFKPRDIVSGDFYWVANKEERLFVVTADCSGNGVAGAFMSLLGISFLDEIVGKQASVGAGQVINELRTKIIASLKQIGETDEQKNGMELSLLVLDYKNRKVEFAGAYNPCFKVRAMNEEEIMLWERGKFETDSETESNGRYLLETVNASKMPVGISTKTNQDFIQSEWKMEKTFSYYLFTDGYLDQFNGLTGKKFLRKNFRKLILDVQDFPMNKQQEILGERFKSWMGSSPQTDDVLVIGFKAD